ncbi:MAG TPA: glycosyltransferase, partial [Gemmatimonadaceae bacterium]
MRILLLTQFYWPEERSAPMNLAALAEFLQANGHEVTVVTGFPNHPFGRLYPGYRMRWRQWDEVRGVRVLRVPLHPDHSLSVPRRGWSYASFALSAATLGAWLTRRVAPDVLLVYLPPLTNWLPVRLLTWIHGVPVVYWETDLWPDALAATGHELPAWI